MSFQKLQIALVLRLVFEKFTDTIVHVSIQINIKSLTWTVKSVARFRVFSTIRIKVFSLSVVT